MSRFGAVATGVAGGRINVRGLWFIILPFVVGVSIGSPLRAACPYPSATQWTYNSLANGSDDAGDVAIDGLGNVVVVGSEDRPDLGQKGNWLILKYDVEGSILWNRSYNSPANDQDWASGVAIDGANNIIVAGNESRTDLGQEENWLIRKYDPAGTLLWSRSYNSPGDGVDQLHDVAVDHSDNIIVVGWEDREPDLGEWANWLIRKYDAGGALVWSRSYNSPADSNDYAMDVAVDSMDNIIVAGTETRSDLGSGKDWRIVKYDSGGNILWSRTYSTPGSSADGWFEMGVAVDGMDNPVVAGIADIQLGGGKGFNWHVKKYDSLGNHLWSRDYNSPANDMDAPFAVAVDKNENIYVAGVENRPDLGHNFDWRVIKYDITGNLVWSRSHNRPPNGGASAYGAAIDGSGNLLVVGTEDRSDLGQSSNMLLIKYTDLCGPVLDVRKTAKAASVTAGSSMLFTISVENTGDVKAVHVTVNDTLPAGMSYVGAGGGKAVVFANPLVSWTLADINPGDPPVVLTMTVTGAIPGTYVNTATALYDDGFAPVLTACSNQAQVTVLEQETVQPVMQPPYQGPVRVFPNPFNPTKAIRGTVKFEGLRAGSRVRVYASSGLRVWEGKGSASCLVEWDGKTGDGKPVAPGAYLWTSEGGGKQERGVLIVE